MHSPLQIQDYQIHLPPLGEGTFGTVYRATYRGISDRALKIFRKDAVDLSSMARELEKLSSVAEHHGIVTLHDFDLLNETPYYAMGLHADQAEDGDWDARTLEGIVGEVDTREAWRLLTEISEALAYLHRHHIIHCDIKTSNIMLTDETPRRVKICDFGQSRGDLFDAADPAGTPLYAPPEQLRHPSDSASGKGFRWDVYSFGVVAYKLITGKLPRLQGIAELEDGSYDPEASVVDASMEATMADSGLLDGEHLAQLTEKERTIEWPAGVRLRQDRRELIERCLKLDPADRFADMREVYGAMQEVDQQARVRRASRLNALFAILLVVAIWASGFAFVQARRATEATSRAMESRDQAQDLVFFIFDKLQDQLSSSGQVELLEHISDNADTYLQNLPDNQRTAQTMVEFSAKRSRYNGARALESGDYAKALEHFASAYEIHSQLAENEEDGRLEPEVAEDLASLGEIYASMGDYPNAIERFSRALDLRLQNLVEPGKPNPDELRQITEVARSLSDSHLGSGNAAASAAALSGAIDLHVALLPDLQGPATYFPVLISLANLQLTLAAQDEEEDDLAAAEAIYASVLAQKPEFERAPPLFREGSELALARAYRGLGGIALAKDERESALSHLSEELKIRRRRSNRAPLDSDAKMHLAETYAAVARCFSLQEPQTRNLAYVSLDRAIKTLERLPPVLLQEGEAQQQLTSYRMRLDEILELDE